MSEASPGSGALGDRIVVVGTTGSGKTTLARQLSRLLGMPHIELDALFWGANWTPVPTEVFRDRVAEAVQEEMWVLDGNYSVARDIVWPRAETLVWLRYPFLTTFRQLFSRTVRRVISKEKLWSGNQERFREQFLSRDSLFLWAIGSYRRQQKNYPVLFNNPQYVHLNVVSLRSPIQTKEWLSRLELPAVT